MNFDLPQVSEININFELLKGSKMTSLKIYISSVTEKLETSIWTPNKHDWKSSIGYSAWGSSDVISFNHLTNLFISSYRGAVVKQQKQHCGRRW